MSHPLASLLLSMLRNCQPDVFQDKRFFPYLYSLFNNAIDDVRSTIISTLFDSKLSKMIPNDSLHFCLAKLCTNNITNEIFAQLLASFTSKAADTFWALCYSILLSNDPFNNAKNIFTVFGPLKSFV